METAKFYSRKSLPGNRWLRAAIAVAVAAFTMTFLWLAMVLRIEWLAAVPLLGILPCGYLWFWVRRCPECGERLSVRRENHPTTKVLHMLLRCDRCLVDWDTGYRIDYDHN
jgi:hypothetical protein